MTSDSDSQSTKFIDLVNFEKINIIQYVFKYLEIVLCTVEKFKFSEFLLDDKNPTYLSYIILVINYKY